MNKNKYDSLPADLQKVIDANTGHAFGDWAAKLIDANDARQKENIRAMEGHAITLISGANLAEYKKVLKPLAAEWLKEMKGKKLDGDSVLARAKEIIAVYN